MGLYDLISEISQKQCEKLYETKVYIGDFDTINEKITINYLEFDLDDVILCKNVCNYLSEDNFKVICLQTQNRILVIDKLGVF